ncbi:MAG TPA: SDR family oxidoreductase [Bacteroidales bacterium]|nr:SDR family oxidoreductase [Bacteroidales bacterium]HRX97969.1 SDR family oxidoreductase [Bacteroidales bacterium]
MKTILVTGANRGIGLEICRQLDQLGHRVILCARDLEKGKKAAQSLSDRVFPAELDVSDQQSIMQLFEIVSEKFGKLDVLINNAGIYENVHQGNSSRKNELKNFIDAHIKTVGKVARKFTPAMRRSGLINKKPNITTVDPYHVREIMETNFYGPLQMIQTFLPLLEKSGSASIINMSSGSGQLEQLQPESPAYSLSKAGLNALTIMFANELKTKGIIVNAMCPGWVKTDMGGPNAPRDVQEGADTAVWIATTQNIPTGKFFRDRKEIAW